MGRYFGNMTTGLETRPVADRGSDYRHIDTPGFKTWTIDALRGKAFFAFARPLFSREAPPLTLPRAIMANDACGPSLRCGSPLYAQPAGGMSSPRPISCEGGPSLRFGPSACVVALVGAFTPRPIFYEGGMRNDVCFKGLIHHSSFIHHSSLSFNASRSTLRGLLTLDP